MGTKTKEEPLWQQLTRKWDMTSWYPILAGCLVVWFLSCNKSTAEYIAANKNTLAVMTVIFYGILLCYAFYRKADTRTLVGLILLGGFLLRAWYVLSASYGISLHDLRAFAGFDTAESGEGHLGYIEYLYKNHHMPDFDPRTRWSYYQPPGFHIISAIVLGITRVFQADAPLCYEGLQVVTLFFSSLTVWIGYRILKEFPISDSWVLLMTAFIAVHPFYSIMAVTLTNDSMAMCLMAFAIWYTIRWKKSPEIKNILVIALAVGTAMFTKLNAAVISFGIGFIFIYVFWINRNQWKSYLLQFTVFLAVCAPIGLWYPIRNSILYRIPLSYVQKISTAQTDLYITESTFWARMGLPTWKQLSYPFLEFEPNLHSNVWIQTMKTSLFDEIRPDVGSSLFQSIALILLWVAILLVILMNYAMIRDCITRKGKQIPITLFLLIEYVTMLVSYLVFCFKEPFLCTMNFRYIPLTFWIPVIGTAFWMQKDSEAASNKRLAAKNHTGKAGHTHPVFRSVLLCALAVFIVLSVLVDLDFVAWSNTSL